MKNSKLWRAIERALPGHKTIGPVTVYGANAMHWAVNISTRRWGYVCFTLPLPCFGKWWPVHFYCSPNATPWASTFYRGLGNRHWERRRAWVADERRRLFGHNFSTDAFREELRLVNERVDA